MNSPIILIGPMGAGKSSIGKRLARRLSLPYRDTDQLVEERTGVPITTIFELEGEKGFRQRENKVLAECSSAPAAVVATGGGIIILEENQKLLSANKHVVYLKASVNSQFQRTRNDKKRPLLQTEDPLLRLQQLADQRNPIYQRLANITINTDQQSMMSSAEEIIQELGLH